MPEKIIEAKFVPNPFRPTPGEVSVPQAPTALSTTDQSRAIAEVQAALVIARSNPRDPIAAMDRVLNACTRPTLAKLATYAYSRGDTSVAGPSIRLAETLAQNWGNIQYGIREISQARGVSTVAAYAWDVQTNVRREVIFEVPHKRKAKGAVQTITDPRDIYELVANQGARRVRACILSVIPSDVVEAAVAQCEKTLLIEAKDTGFDVTKLEAAFSEIGVAKAQIEKRIGCRLEAIRPAQIVQLRSIYSSIKDGMSDSADWFDELEDQPKNQQKIASGNSGLKAKLAAPAAAPVAATQSEAAPAEAPAE